MICVKAWTFARAAAVAAALLVPLSVTAPASARSYDDCPSNRFCAWASYDGTGARAGFTNGTDDLSRVGLNAGARSVYNLTGATWCIFSGTEYSGRKQTVAPGVRFNPEFVVRSLYRPDGIRCST
jgi:hypothetical protein